MLGSAIADANVTVNQQATIRKGSYFYKELTVDNSVTPMHQEVKVVGVKNNAGANGEDAVEEQSGKVFVPAAVESFQYDADGNLLRDGRWSYVWDAENRLMSLTALPNVPVTAKQRLEFSYDAGGRRILKTVLSWNAQTNAYQPQKQTKFVYDGWNLVAELE